MLCIYLFIYFIYLFMHSTLGTDHTLQFISYFKTSYFKNLITRSAHGQNNHVLKQ